MTSESNRISAASTSYVDGVCVSWGWTWQGIDQVNDDGLDGIVYLRTKRINVEKPKDRRFWKHGFTGGMIHIQVKTGPSHIESWDADRIEINIENLDQKRSDWMKSPIPVALVYVKEVPQGSRPKKGWWVDLKAPSSYTAAGTVIIPCKNRFDAGLECRRPFSRLASGQHRKLALEQIDMCSQGLLPNKLAGMSKPVKFAAMDFYKQWAAIETLNPQLGTVIVNRTGWSHITRVGRPLARIQASLELLPAAARIIQTVNDYKILRTGRSERNYPDGTWAIYEYIGLSALVKWAAREPSEVMVIVRRQTIFVGKSDVAISNEAAKYISRKTWFYTVYEPARRK